MHLYPDLTYLGILMRLLTASPTHAYPRIGRGALSCKSRTLTTVTESMIAQRARKL